MAQYGPVAFNKSRSRYVWVTFTPELAEALVERHENDDFDAESYKAVVDELVENLRYGLELKEADDAYRNQ